MSLSIGEANAVSTVLRWIGVPSHAGAERPSDTAALAALQLLRAKAYKTLSAGATAQEVDVAFGQFVQTKRGQTS